MRIHTQPPRPSEFTSPPSYRLPERTSSIVSHIAEILPDRVLYLHFWTINSLSSSVRRYLWNTGHGGSLSVVQTGGSRMTLNQRCTAGEESPSIPVSQVSHPWPKDVWIRELSWRMVMSLMSMSGRLSRMSLFSFRRSWMYRSQSTVWPGSRNPQAGCHPDPPKNSGHNFPRRRSCPELPSSKRLRMFLLQWLPLRLGSIVANPWLVASHQTAKELCVNICRTKREILERNVASSLSSYRSCSDAKLSS